MAYFPLGKELTNNSFIETLAGSGSTSKTYENVEGFASISLRVKAAGAGTYHVFFSEDGITDDTDITYTYDPADTNAQNLQIFDVLAKYYAVQFTDTSTSSNAVRIQSIGGQEKTLKVSLNRVIARDAPALITRSLPDWYDLVSGKFGSFDVINKFGRNDATGTTYAPVALGGIYRTPQLGSGSTLRIKAGNAGDDSASTTGARTVIIYGLDDTTMANASETLTCAGTSASSASSTTFSRLYRIEIEGSGVYGDSATGSHAADIVIENSAGTEDWGTIDNTGFPKAQSEIGCYPIPAGYTGYVFVRSITTDTAKTTDAILFVREGADETSPPYHAVKANRVFVGLKSPIVFNERYPVGEFTGPCDTGFMAKVDSGTATVAVEYDIVLIKT